MRQIGSLEIESYARRFAAYLVTQGIDAHCEADGNSWDIWVRDEDHLQRATQEFAHFEKNPEDKKYRGVEQQADEIRKADQERRVKAQKNIVEMRNNWSRTASKKRPLTVTMIALCILLGMLTGFGGTLQTTEKQAGPVMSALLFLDPHHVFELHDSLQAGEISGEEYQATLDSPAFRLTDILNGQVWRLITPSFLHLGLWHIVMNMWMLFVLGGLIESRYGTVWFAVLWFALQIPSELIPNLLPESVGGSVVSLGMSGVIFGLFGFAWMKSSFDPQAGFRIPPSMVIFILAYFFIGISGFFPVLNQIGHWAHGVGLACGMLIGYFPEIVKSLRGR